MLTTDQNATYIAVTDGETKATHTHVVLDDGSEFVVRTGRTADLIAWDKLMSRKFDRNTQVFIFAAFLAWRAAETEGFYKQTFDQFTDEVADLTPVRLADSPAEAPGDPVPPTTRTAPSA